MYDNFDENNDSIKHCDNVHEVCFLFCLFVCFVYQKLRLCSMFLVKNSVVINARSYSGYLLAFLTDMKVHVKQKYGMVILSHFEHG